ncbi:hypothetical protein AURDEDRAFT_178282 [Auricularia subglabra TFB-10046 SS5]|uniref:Uncharacterized protein n=1 Tax=Auricularia subglabra (strain TFB-10046 / SS5) TaxID=717982 RepID=J0WK11_AURST|nr:hypothetical protein AURDEDRAFT_178282 [Auricularia subglabra TFB-10046 SS5]
MSFIRRLPVEIVTMVMDGAARPAPMLTTFRDVQGEPHPHGFRSTGIEYKPVVYSALQVWY